MVGCALETLCQTLLQTLLRASGSPSMRCGFQRAPLTMVESLRGARWNLASQWKKDKWAILFSHPADFTPVCTTEIGRLAIKYDELVELDCLVATLSVDPVKSHEEWLEDVVAHCAQPAVSRRASALQSPLPVHGWP